MFGLAVKTGDFMPTMQAVGFSKRQGKEAESSAVSAIKLLFETTTTQAHPLIS
jgi:hypothetical protein